MWNRKYTVTSSIYISPLTVFHSIQIEEYMWDYAIQSTQFRTIIIRKEFVNREKYQFEEYDYTNHPLYKVIKTGRRMEN